MKTLLRLNVLTINTLLPHAKALIYLLIFIIIGNCTLAQTRFVSTDTFLQSAPADTLSKQTTSIPDAPGSPKRNNVKINLSSLLLNNYSLYYERSLSRKITFQAGYRFQPNSSILKNSLAKQIIKTAIELDEETEKDINSFTTSNNTYTGEFRFYGGKRDGAKGFYLGLYGRYATFNCNYTNYNFETDNAQAMNIPLKGKIKGLGGGLIIGAQWWFGKAVCMDLYLLGGHYGSLKGSFSGSKNLTALSDGEKQRLKSDLEETLVIGDRQFINTTVNNNGITGKVNGPYIGIRAAGLSVGIVF